MIGWLASRRLARKEAEAEKRLVDLIRRNRHRDGEVAIHGGLVETLGVQRTNRLLAEHGLPPLVERSRWDRDAA